MNAVNSQFRTSESWKIETVSLNGEMVCEDDFQTLFISSTTIRIEPAGIVLSIRQASERGILLRSGLDMYFGYLTQHGSQLDIELSSPTSPNLVTIVAKLDYQDISFTSSTDASDARHDLVPFLKAASSASAFSHR